MIQAFVPVEVRGQLSGVAALLPPYGFQGLNSGLQVWQLAPLLSELSHLTDSFLKGEF